MPTVWLDAVFKPFFKIVHDTGKQLTIDGTNFLTDGFLQKIRRTGFVSVNTWFQIPPKKKVTRWKIGRARGPRHVSETGNEVPGKHVSNNGHWRGLQCALWHHLVETKHWHSLLFFGAVLALGLPTEYYPFEKCQVPVGHLVYTITGEKYLWFRNFQK